MHGEIYGNQHLGLGSLAKLKRLSFKGEVGPQEVDPIFYLSKEFSVYDGPRPLEQLHVTFASLKLEQGSWIETMNVYGGLWVQLLPVAAVFQISTLS